MQWPRAGSQQSPQSGKASAAQVSCGSVSEDFWMLGFPGNRCKDGTREAEGVEVGTGVDSNGETEEQEVDALRSALQRAKEKSMGVPVHIQSKEGEQFLVRARAHLAEIQSARHHEVEHCGHGASIGTIEGGLGAGTCATVGVGCRGSEIARGTCAGATARNVEPMVGLNKCGFTPYDILVFLGPMFSLCFYPI